MKMKFQTTPGLTKRNGAFTLVEMLLVLVILATLAAIVIPKMAGRREQALARRLAEENVPGADGDGSGGEQSARKGLAHLAETYEADAHGRRRHVFLTCDLIDLAGG